MGIYRGSRATGVIYSPYEPLNTKAIWVDESNPSNLSIKFYDSTLLQWTPIPTNTIPAPVTPPSVKGFGYQDFLASEITSTSLKITKNENGNNITFDATKIIGDTAVIVSLDNPQDPVFTSDNRNIFVISQLVDDVILNDIPDPSKGCRVYYYYQFGSLPANYTVPPKNVTDSLLNQFFYESLPYSRTTSETIFTLPNYVIGSNSLLVFLDGQLKSKTIDYVEASSNSIEFNYPIDVNRHVIVVNIGGISAVPKLKEIVDDPIVIPASSFKTLSYDTGFDKIDVRTLRVICSDNLPIQVVIYESTNGTSSPVYVSLEDTSIYDILNLPYTDKDGTQQIHILIKNSNLSDVNVSLDIKLTNLL